DIIASRLSLPADIAPKTDENALLLDALIASVALQAVLSVIDPEVPFSTDEIVDGGLVAPGSAPLFAYLLDLLARFGAASIEGSRWQLHAANDLPDIAEIWRMLLAETPELVAELALIAAAAEDLPRLLADGPRQAE